jgi:hypothetical protein
MTKSKVTTLCVHADLYAVVKAQAKAEGTLVKDWSSAR